MHMCPNAAIKLSKIGNNHKIDYKTDEKVQFLIKNDSRWPVTVHLKIFESNQRSGVVI